MKKKYYLSALTLLIVGGVIAGCRNRSDNTDSSTKTSVSTTSMSDSTDKNQSESGETSETPKSSSSSSASTSEITTESPEEQAKQVLDQLAASFPADNLPTFILTANTKKYISAATTPITEKTNFRILYYAEDQPINVNSSELNSLKPIASFEKVSFNSADEAKNAVGKLEDYSGQEVDLGFGLTGYQQGAAGSSYLTWPEGNWNLTIKASNIEGENPVSLGKEVVNYLEENTLPAPNTDGTIRLEVGENGEYQTNSVVWQEQTIVYKIHHFNAIQAVKMAVSAN
ncbi:hypothetical protein [Enterococcus sp. CWB-B31]|uniref:hypothetical protein n=1 Tax=Enterococcus sp. CWB-B31 TaxID=2885159 RepID=UPI001E4AB515|nr:hypothetical protein [Enterococcus sp. CWB-B31]MCB5956419.1 hypothetical protein [Enterococcus sp. CWB-B31]